MGCSCCCSNGYREWVSYTRATAVVFTKISAVSDTACGSEPCLCPEQSAARRPLLEQGLLRELFQLRHSLNPPLSSPGRHCHGNQTLAGHCQQANVGFTKLMLLFISSFLNKKSKSCSRSCVWCQWYLSVLAVVLHWQCEYSCNVRSWQIAPCYSDPLHWEVLCIFLPLWWRWDGEGASPALLPQAEVAYCLLFISSYPSHQDQSPHEEVS